MCLLFVQGLWPVVLSMSHLPKLGLAHKLRMGGFVVVCVALLIRMKARPSENGVSLGLPLKAFFPMKRPVLRQSCQT